MSVCLSVCIWLSVCLSVSGWLSVCLSVSGCLSVFYLSVSCFLPAYLFGFFCLFFCLPVCIWLSPHQCVYVNLILILFPVCVVLMSFPSWRKFVIITIIFQMIPLRHVTRNIQLNPNNSNFELPGFNCSSRVVVEKNPGKLYDVFIQLLPLNSFISSSYCLFLDNDVSCFLSVAV